MNQEESGQNYKHKNLHRAIIEFVNEHIFTILFFPAQREVPFSFVKKFPIFLYAPKSEFYAEMNPAVIKKELVILDFPTKIIHQKMAIQLPKIYKDRPTVAEETQSVLQTSQARSRQHLRSSHADDQNFNVDRVDRDY